MAAACAMLLGTLVLLLLIIDSGVITGLLRGGHLHGLRGARLKALPLLVAALMLQLLLGLAWFQVPGGRWGIGSVLLLVSLVLLVVVVVRANRPVLGARVGIFGIQTVVSVGDVLRYLGLFLLIQALMVRNAGRRPKAAAPPGPWATLLRVAWLAILLGLLLQLALLLVAVGFGTAPSPGPLLAETLKTVSWSLLVCVGVALGRVAAKGRLPLEGITGLLAAPLALTAANTVQKGVAEAVNAAGVPAGPAPLWVLAIKAAEYACLGLALNWVGRRAWGSALGHLAVGLMVGVVFGGMFLTVVVQSAPTPLAAPALLGRGVNELLFPVGCALVVFIAEVLRPHLDPATAADRPLTASIAAAADQPTPDPSAAGAGSGSGTLTVGPWCGLERGHWACLNHRRTFRTRRTLNRHTHLGEHRLVWLCWAHGPEQPSPEPAGHPDGDRQAPDRALLPLAKVSQRGHRRSA
jgi:hypothetical protein